MSTTRDLARVITAHRQHEGAGFIVRRPVPGPGLDLIDPFLLIDELGPIDYAPGQAVGAPDHPHRGFETVSYILEGEMEHEDSAGHRGFLRAGDVQWMTAGGGIVHSEMPSRQIQERGGRVHGFQIWVNLPASLKMTRPRYQEVPAARIPTATSADGKATVRVVAGEALGVRAVIDTHTPISFHEWRLAPGADVTTAIASDQQVLVYVFAGKAIVGDGATVIKDGQLAVLAAGDAVRLRGNDTDARLLLLAGKPLREPVARHGPFVMNTRQQLIEAFEDFQSGRMGEITRTAIAQ
ncbi:MAG: pirin family protein [Deltaproteobacteria bacterium]|nr:pirin family protein [Deltaproteobacteria bacterium]